MFVNMSNSTNSKFVTPISAKISQYEYTNQSLFGFCFIKSVSATHFYCTNVHNGGHCQIYKTIKLVIYVVKIHVVKYEEL